MNKEDLDYIYLRIGKCTHCLKPHKVGLGFRLWVRFCLFMGMDKNWIITNYWEVISKKYHV